MEGSSARNIWRMGGFYPGYAERNSNLPQPKTELDDVAISHSDSRVLSPPVSAGELAFEIMPMFHNPVPCKKQHETIIVQRSILNELKHARLVFRPASLQSNGSQAHGRKRSDREPDDLLHGRAVEIFLYERICSGDESATAFHEHGSSEPRETLLSSGRDLTLEQRRVLRVHPQQQEHHA